MDSHAARTARLVSLAIVVAASARGEATQDPARATIRGSGTNVTIVYRGGKQAPAQEALKAPESAGVLAEAVRLKTRGADDTSVIAYLRANQADLPPVTEAAVVKQLRKAGAGEALISDLSRMTALDIGETGEPGAVVMSPAAPQLAPYGMPYEGAYGGGYALGAGYGYGGRGGMRFGRHGFPPANLVVFHRGKPAFHGPVGMHGSPSHRPMVR